MTISTKNNLAVDAEGFVSHEALRQAAAETTVEDFVLAYPLPALVMNMERPDEASPGRPGPADKERSLRRTVVVSLAEERPRPAPRSRYHERIAFLRKRPGNPFPHMISLGRSMNNDIVLVVDTVSKFQGYFITKDGRWSFTDQHSANGTLLNGKLLEKGTRQELACGDRLKMGVAVEGRFLTPAALFQQLRGA